LPTFAQALQRGKAGGLLAYLAVEQRHWEMLHGAYFANPFLRKQRSRHKDLMRGCLDRSISGALGVLVGLSHSTHQPLVLGVGAAAFAPGM